MIHSECTTENILFSPSISPVQELHVCERMSSCLHVHVIQIKSPSILFFQKIFLVWICVSARHGYKTPIQSKRVGTGMINGIQLSIVLRSQRIDAVVERAISMHKQNLPPPTQYTKNKNYWLKREREREKSETSRQHKCTAIRRACSQKREENILPFRVQKRRCGHVRVME